MFKSVSFYGAFNEQTGYGLHATQFIRELEKLIPVVRNKPGGEVSISLIDSVSLQHVSARCPYPSICYSVWESSLQPQKAFDNIKKYYDQLWTPSRWQANCSIAQGLSPDFVKVCPEGVDPSVYKPSDKVSLEIPPIFDFLIVGKWEDRKYTREMIKAWREVFPDNPNVRLYLSCDNPFPVDQYKTTEERLKAYGYDMDKRIIPVHFEDKNAHIKRLQAAHAYISCSRAEGWNLPLIESLACGIPSIALDYSGSTEFYNFTNLLVGVDHMIKPFNVYGQPNCPGQWAEPDYEDLKATIEDVYANYPFYKKQALAISQEIHSEFSWESAAKKAYKLLEELWEINPNKPIECKIEIKTNGGLKTTGGESLGNEIRSSSSVAPSVKPDIFVIGCWPSSTDRMNTLVETINQIKSLGFPILISTHYALPPAVIEMADYYLYEKTNVLSGDWKAAYHRQHPDGHVETKQCNKEYHCVAALNTIRNAIDFCKPNFNRLFFTEFDLEVDMPSWVNKVNDSKSPVCMIDYESTGVRTDFWAGDISYLDKIFPYIRSWDEYMSYGYPYVFETWMWNYCKDRGLDKDVSILTQSINNRFDQVDHDVWDDDIFSCHFVEGPWVQIAGLSNRVYNVTFSTPTLGTPFRQEQKCGTWSRPSIKFYQDWEVKAMIGNEVKFYHKIDLKDKRVLISMGSKALGDSIAWMPFLEEFRLKHNCKVIASTFWNNLWDYPEIEFVEPGTSVLDLYASYEVGCYDNQPNMNPSDWRTVTLQQVSSDILGLPYKEIKPRLKIPEGKPTVEGKYICFSEFSTMESKLWNKPGSWQTIIDYLNKLGYKCVALGLQASSLRNVIKHHGQSIEDTICDLINCEFYVGLGHGPSWLAWACNKPVVMISGFSETWAEFENPYRVIRNNVCHGCFNDVNTVFDRGWEWCPRKKFNGKKVDKYECTRKITTDMVIKTIDQLRKDKGLL